MQGMVCAQILNLTTKTTTKSFDSWLETPRSFQNSSIGYYLGSQEAGLVSYVVLVAALNYYTVLFAIESNFVLGLTSTFPMPSSRREAALRSPRKRYEI